MTSKWTAGWTSGQEDRVLKEVVCRGAPHLKRTVSLTSFLKSCARLWLPCSNDFLSRYLASISLLVFLSYALSVNFPSANSSNNWIGRKGNKTQNGRRLSVNDNNNVAVRCTYTLYMNMQVITRMRKREGER